MTMRPLEDDEIERYVAADLPVDCCGAYKVETLGISLMASVEGPDFTAIVGLPLISLSEALRRQGLTIP